MSYSPMRHSCLRCGLDKDEKAFPYSRFRISRYCQECTQEMLDTLHAHLREVMPEARIAA